jgi:hypothetical protein
VRPTRRSATACVAHDSPLLATGDSAGGDRIRDHAAPVLRSVLVGLLGVPQAVPRIHPGSWRWSRCRIDRITRARSRSVTLKFSMRPPWVG